MYSIDKNRISGSEVINYLYNMCNNTNIKYTINNLDTLHSGSRRINILVVGRVDYIMNNINHSRNFSDYIHLSKDKENNFWIINSMFILI